MRSSGMEVPSGELRRSCLNPRADRVLSPRPEMPGCRGGWESAGLDPPPSRRPVGASKGFAVADAVVDSLVLDLLEWVAPHPRPYREGMDAWRTSCPRLPVWEEANDRGFVTRLPG